MSTPSLLKMAMASGSLAFGALTFAFCAGITSAVDNDASMWLLVPYMLISCVVAFGTYFAGSRCLS